MGDLVGEVRALVNLGRLSSEYGVVELDELDLLTQAELLLVPHQTDFDKFSSCGKL